MTEETAEPTPQVPEKPAQPTRPRSERIVRMAEAQSRVTDKSSKAPEPKPEPPPQLTPHEVYHSGPRLRDLDAQIEQELAEALGDLSEKELYGSPAEEKRKATPGTPQEGKKAKVIAVQGNDVFLDIPGGRSQG